MATKSPNRPTNKTGAPAPTTHAPAGGTTQQTNVGGPRPLIPWTPIPAIDREKVASTPELKQKIGTMIYHERAQQHEVAVWENVKILDNIELAQAEYREQIAEMLTRHSEAYQNSAREYINQRTLEEQKAQENYYEVRQKMRYSLRSWRLAVVKAMEDESFVTNVRPNLTEFTRLIVPDNSTSVLTNTGMLSVIVPRKHVMVNTSSILGKGAFGSVYRGIVYGNRVAIKELRLDTTDTNPETIRSFLTEVELMSQIKSDRILRFMGACIENQGSQPYYALFTEIAENGSLADILYKRKDIKLSLQRKFKIIGEIVEGMKHLHGLPKQVLHLDLKPANILLDIDYHVLIADFGMSKVRSPDAVKRELGVFVGGTPVYMAPEVIAAEFGSKGASVKSDVYSFAILINELIDERLPYSEPDSGSLQALTATKKQSLTFENLKSKVNVDPPKEGVNRPVLLERLKQSKSLRQMITDCWQTDPDKRPHFKELTRRDKQGKDITPWVLVLNELATGSDTLNLVLRNKLTECMGNAQSISFMEMLNVLIDVYKINHETLIDKSGNNQPANNQYVLMFKYLFDVANYTENRIQQDVIYRFFEWTKGIERSNLLATLYTTMTEHWFNGVTHPNELPSLFRGSSNGSYTVVWNRDRAQGPAWVLMYLKKKEIEMQDLEGCRAMGELKEAVNTHVARLNLKGSPIPQVGVLKALRFKDKYLVSSSSYLVNQSNSAEASALDFNRPGTIASHFTFVL